MGAGSGSWLMGRGGEDGRGSVDAGTEAWNL